MNFFISKKRIVLLFLLYMFLYSYPSFANPFIPLNILEFSVVTILAIVGFYIIFFYNIKNKNSNNQTFTTIIVILLGINLFYSPLKFSSLYNFYPPRLLAILIIVAWITLITIYSKKSYINPTFSLIIFIPVLIQAILMSFKQTIGIYITFPYLTTVLIIVGIIIVNLKKKIKL